MAVQYVSSPLFIKNESCIPLPSKQVDDMRMNPGEELLLKMDQVSQQKNIH